MLLVPGKDFRSIGNPATPWDAVEACLRRLMATCRAGREAVPANGGWTAHAIFDLLTDREYCYLSKSRVAPYRPAAIASIESAVRGGEPIDFSYDLGPGYHASIQPGVRELSFDVGLGELFVLGQIASFARGVKSMYPPGVKFHIVIDNLCALFVNDIPVVKTLAYCARFRELIEFTGLHGVVDLIVESEHFRIDDFDRLTDAAAPAPCEVDSKAHNNIVRFLGRPCSESEASARLQRHHAVIAESERLLKAVIRGIHMTQRATPDTICFRPFPGGDSRIQCGEVVLGWNVAGRLYPFLLTSHNAAAYCCQRALFPSILPPMIGAITYAEAAAPI
jgi:hypothetical protein